MKKILFLLALTYLARPASAQVEWTKCIGGSDHDEIYNIHQTTDGGYIAAGQTFSNDGDVSGMHGVSGNYLDAWVVKLSSSGALEWQKCLGGTSTDYANAVQQTADGGYIVAGYTNSTDGDVWRRRRG